MKKWMAFGLGLAIYAGLTHRLGAQDAAPAGPPAAAAAAPGAAGQAGGFLGGLKGMCASCKAALCASPLGQMLNNSMAPLSAMSGGLIPPCCPAINPADLAKGGALGAAAKIKQEEAAVKAKRAAIRYLSTLDCHWWPEAEAALIAALRAERNECVRMEAALALGRGCCCTKRTMTALLITVNGTDEDNNFSENSDRVKAVAAQALAHCLSCYQEVKSAKGPGPLEKPPVSLPDSVRKEQEKKLLELGLPAFYTRMDKVTWEQLADKAEKTLAHSSTAVPPPGTVVQAPAGHSLAEIVAKAVAPQDKANPATGRIQPVPTATNSLEPAMVGQNRTPAVTLGPMAMNQNDPTAIAVLPEAPEIVTGQGSPAALAVSTGPPIVNGSPYAATNFAAQPDSTPAPAAAVPHRPWWARLRTGHSQETVSAVPAGPASQNIASSSAVTSVGFSPEATPGLPTAAKVEVLTPSAKPEEQSPTAAAPITNHRQMLALLRESVYPEQREWAADNLAGFDWKLSPEIVDSLLNSARADRVSTVRVACLRCLSRMNANTPQVIATVRFLQTDNDAQVRSQAEESLAKLSSSPTETAIPLTR